MQRPGDHCQRHSQRHAQTCRPLRPSSARLLELIDRFRTGHTKAQCSHLRADTALSLAPGQSQRDLEAPHSNAGPGSAAVALSATGMAGSARACPSSMAILAARQAIPRQRWTLQGCSVKLQNCKQPKQRANSSLPPPCVDGDSRAKCSRALWTWRLTVRWR